MAEQYVITNAMEMTRRLFAAANGGDYDAMMDFYGPDSVWDVSAWGLGTHTGLDAIRRFFEDWIGGFEDYMVEAEKMHDLGNGVIYSIAIQHGWTSSSRRSLRLRSASVFVWADGVATEVTHHRDISAGRAAAERLARAKPLREARARIAG
jgi:ketosteroid isomerase-like protein